MLTKVVHTSFWEGEVEEMVLSGGGKAECYGRLQERRPSQGRDERLQAEQRRLDGGGRGRGKVGCGGVSEAAGWVNKSSN